MDRAEKLLNITEASDYCGIHPATLRGYVREGLMPCYRLPGGHLRFAVSALNYALAGFAAEFGEKQVGA